MLVLYSHVQHKHKPVTSQINHCPAAQYAGRERAENYATLSNSFNLVLLFSTTFLLVKFGNFMKSLLNVMRQIFYFSIWGIYGLYSQNRKTHNNQICGCKVLIFSWSFAIALKSFKWVRKNVEPPLVQTRFWYQVSWLGSWMNVQVIDIVRPSVGVKITSLIGPNWCICILIIIISFSCLLCVCK